MCCESDGRRKRFFLPRISHSSRTRIRSRNEYFLHRVVLSAETLREEDFYLVINQRFSTHIAVRITLRCGDPDLDVNRGGERTSLSLKRTNRAKRSANRRLRQTLRRGDFEDLASLAFDHNVSPFLQVHPTEFRIMLRIFKSSKLISRSNTIRCTCIW